MIQPLFLPVSFSLSMLELILAFLLFLEHIKLILTSRFSYPTIMLLLQFFLCPFSHSHINSNISCSVEPYLIILTKATPPGPEMYSKDSFIFFIALLQVGFPWNQRLGSGFACRKLIRDFLDQHLMKGRKIRGFDEGRN